MKQVVCNRTKAFLLALLILVTSTGLCQSIVALEATQPVTVTTAEEFTNALNTVPDGGTIVISGTCTLPSGYTWKAHSKTVTITGGTLDASAVTPLTIRCSVIFENMTLVFQQGGSVFANGNKLVIKEDVTVQNETYLYGGGNYMTVASTDITIMSGTYKKIYGGGLCAPKVKDDSGNEIVSVRGDVHAYIGGKVNASINHTYHTEDDGPIYRVFGGSNGGLIKGSVYLTFADNAKANYVFGGSCNSGGVGNSIHLNVTGGKMMSIYGSGDNSNAGWNPDYTGCDIYATITGGEVEQIFGGSQSANHKGNITLRVLGGKITRRIYGGCYNNYNGSWGSSLCVDGDITLVIGSGANITFDYSKKEDISIFAKSRHNTDIDKGTCKLVFADDSASTKYKGATGVYHGWSDLLYLTMRKKAVADSTHTLKHEKTSDTVVTESCTTCSSSCDLNATATLALSSNQFEYTGSEITPATMTYTGSWLGDEPQISYSNNVNIGDATVTATYARYSINLTTNFTITKIKPATPVLTAVNETIQGKADGKIRGLTTEMEYSADGETFIPVTDPNMTFTPGTYLVRTPETDIQSASETVTVTIGTNRHIMDINLLNVKYQLPLDASLESESISPRLIASLDKLYYDKVGFEISKQSEDGEWSAFEALETKVAFISIIGTVDGTDVTYTPGEEYGNGASYFFVQNTSAISAEDFDTVLRIRAYVVTEDGYTLYGTPADFRLSAVLS